MVIIRTWQQLSVGIEVIAYGREDALHHVFLTNGREVELWTCYREHNINKVINKERCCQYKSPFLEKVIPANKIPQGNRGNHRVIRKIA